jgi:hypothetical protein
MFILQTSFEPLLVEGGEGGSKVRWFGTVEVSDCE